MMKKRTMIRVLATALSLTVCIGSLKPAATETQTQTLTAYASYENTYVNTGNQREDITRVALTQVGYHEGANNETKYNHWLGKIDDYPANGFGYPWCHCYVSWAAAQAGISSNIIPRTAGTSTGKSFFIKQGRYKQSASNGGNYQPRRGDIIYFGSGSSPSHVGIVTGCDGSKVYTVEGNSNDSVAERSYSLNSSYVIGYGVPNYNNDAAPTQVPESGSIESYLFNADVYYTTYEDLQNAFGYNPAALQQHWLEHGCAEGRFTSIFFDVGYYLNSPYNADLKEAFGDNYAAAYQHFLQYGYNEIGRATSPVYNSEYYRDHNPDLANMSAQELLLHFINHGCKEGRQASAEFDPKFYRYAPGNEDLNAAFGDDWYSYYAHYMEYSIGHGENRPAVGAIRSIQISNVNSNGYRVTIRVVDPNRVTKIAVPVWTQPEGQSDAKSQDDLNPAWQTKCLAEKSGTDTYTYQVKTSDHKHESGRYATDIYVFEGETILERYCIETGKRTYVNVPAPPVTTAAAKSTTTVSTTTKPVATTAMTVPTTAKPVATTTMTVPTTAKPVATTTMTVSTTAKPVTTTTMTVPTTAKPVTTMTTTAAPVQPKKTVLVMAGDVNCDGTVDVSDTVLLSRFIAEDPNVHISAIGRSVADANGDGSITQEDPIFILQIIAKMI